MVLLNFRKKKILFISIFLFIIILNLTIPTEDDYYKWLDCEYNIKKTDKLYYYTQNEIRLFDRAKNHKGFGIFTVRKQNFEYINGEKLLDNSSSVGALKDLSPDEGLTIRTLEIAKMIFSIEKESILWKILM